MLALPAPAIADLLPAPTTLSCRLPFGGFYESLWSHEMDRELEQRVSYAQEDRDYFERTFPALAEIEDKPSDETIGKLHEAMSRATAYRKGEDLIAREYADAFGGWLADALGLVSWTEEPVSPGFVSRRCQAHVVVEFEEVCRPAYYNFETDRLFAKISESALRAALGELERDAPDILAQAFRDLFTSYDGFASFYDNTVPDKDLADWDHNELFALLVAFGRLHGVGHVERVKDRINRVASSFDDLLYESLYEDIYRAADEAVDWAKFEALVEEIADELREELGEIEPRPIRCTGTMELPL